MNKIINIFKNINVFELKKRIEELEADKRVLSRERRELLDEKEDAYAACKSGWIRGFYVECRKYDNGGLDRDRKLDQRQIKLDKREKELNKFQVKINEQILKLEIVNKVKNDGHIEKEKNGE